MTRIVVMSDTHMLHERLVVPDGDVVVHCGDWSGAEGLEEYLAFFAWFSSLPHPHKVLVAGNHESLMRDFPAMLRRRIPANIVYLENESATIAHLRFYGSPCTVGNSWMAFAHDAGDDMDRIWRNVPLETDVLVTHGPPLGILDRNYSGKRVGDEALLRRVDQVRPPTPFRSRARRQRPRRARRHNFHQRSHRRRR